MSRISSSVEERARDVLVTFLLTLDRKPLGAFLDLYSPAGLQSESSHLGPLSVMTEVPTNLGSRSDLVICNDSALLFVEVKVDAVEQVGQYEKYKRYFEREGYVVTAGGLIARDRRSNRKDNAAFLEALGVRRLRWSRILRVFENAFENTPAFREFRQRLSSLSPLLAVQDETSLPVTSTATRDASLLKSRNDVVCMFYHELLERLRPLEGTVWQYGNSPYCLAFGHPYWARKFGEDWFHRAFICLQKKDAAHPCFTFGVMIWNRSWTKNEAWFRERRGDLARYFVKCGFDVGRNEGSSWHRRVSWFQPYDINGLKYANANWTPRVELSAFGKSSADWDRLLTTSANYCMGLAKIIDSVQVD